MTLIFVDPKAEFVTDVCVASLLVCESYQTYILITFYALLRWLLLTKITLICYVEARKERRRNGIQFMSFGLPWATIGKYVTLCWQAD